MSTKNKILVAGASGLVGVAAIESFLAAGWDVVGISRRKPELPSGRDFRFISVDLRDDKAARQALSPLAATLRTSHMRRFTRMPTIWSAVGQTQPRSRSTMPCCAM
jgi:NAD(P)-dependent dehydrogenase (short-subunit alcohol dehydrogenase family)